MEYPYFKGLEADRYSFYRVPKALVKADLFQKMSGDAKLLYAVLLDRMSLSIKNGWQDKHGNAYIICTIEEVMDSIHCARQKAVKLLDELEQEFRLIERRRQGLGKPNLLYVKDLYAGLSQSNYWKYENHTSGSLKNELPGVPKSNGSNTEKINKTDNSETDLIYPAELQEEEQYRHYFKEVLELEILEQGYPADKTVLYEILELLVETVTSRKKFLRICGEDKPKEVVKSRLMKLDSSHIQYILECLKENSTQIRNIKQYLLATLYNAPVTVDEALLFAVQTGISSELTAGEQLRAKLVAHEENACDFVSVTEDTGVRFALDGIRVPWKIYCIRSAYYIYKSYGTALYHEMLSVLVDAWGGDSDSFLSGILHGMARFLALYQGEYSRERLVLRLRTVHPKTITRLAQNDTGNAADCHMKQILSIYNGAGRTHNLPCKR